MLIFLSIVDNYIQSSRYILICNSGILSISDKIFGRIARPVNVHKLADYLSSGMASFAISEQIRSSRVSSRYNPLISRAMAFIIFQPTKFSRERAMELQLSSKRHLRRALFVISMERVPREISIRVLLGWYHK